MLLEERLSRSAEALRQPPRTLTREGIVEALRAARSALGNRREAGVGKPNSKRGRSSKRDELYVQWINVMFYTLCEPFELAGGLTCWLHELTAKEKGANLVPFFAPPLVRYGDALNAVVQLLATVSRPEGQRNGSAQQPSLALDDNVVGKRPARERWVALECAAIVRALLVKHVGEILRDGAAGLWSRGAKLDAEAQDRFVRCLVAPPTYIANVLQREAPPQLLPPQYFAALATALIAFATEASSDGGGGDAAKFATAAAVASKLVAVGHVVELARAWLKPVLAGLSAVVEGGSGFLQVASDLST